MCGDVQLAITALRVVGEIQRLPLPALKRLTDTMCMRIFGLLDTYSGIGAAVNDDNRQLFLQCFKVSITPSEGQCGDASRLL